MDETPHPWTSRIGTSALFLALLAIIGAGLGTTLARYDLIDKMPGFLALVYSTPVAAIAAVMGAASLILAWRNKGPLSRAGAVGLIVSAIFVGGLSLRLMAAGDAPPIHDATTDLENPPSFVELPLPPDHLRGLSGEAEWRELHLQAYGDLVPIRVDGSVSEVLASAETIAREKGWKIVSADVESGRMEATAFASWIRFRDDVVLRVVPEGSQSVVDMRSVSRVGISDLGVNADRIRNFLAELQER